MHKHNFVELKNGTSIYCTLCGKVKKLEHECRYEVLETLVRSNAITGNNTGYRYISRCTICGDIETTEVNV